MTEFSTTRRFDVICVQYLQEWSLWQSPEDTAYRWRRNVEQEENSAIDHGHQARTTEFYVINRILHSINTIEETKRSWTIYKFHPILIFAKH